MDNKKKKKKLSWLSACFPKTFTQCVTSSLFFEKSEIILLSKIRTRALILVAKSIYLPFFYISTSSLLWRKQSFSSTSFHAFDLLHVHVCLLAIDDEVTKFSCMRTLITTDDVTSSLQHTNSLSTSQGVQSTRGW